MAFSLIVDGQHVHFLFSGLGLVVVEPESGHIFSLTDPRGGFWGLWPGFIGTELSGIDPRWEGGRHPLPLHPEIPPSRSAGQFSLIDFSSISLCRVSQAPITDIPIILS